MPQGLIRTKLSGHIETTLSHRIEVVEQRLVVIADDRWNDSWRMTSIGIGVNNVA